MICSKKQSKTPEKAWLKIYPNSFECDLLQKAELNKEKGRGLLIWEVKSNTEKKGGREKK